MKKHSKEVRQLRRQLLNMIEDINFKNTSLADDFYLLALVRESEKHIKMTTSGGDVD